ncbi:hypothetical protein E2562_001213 [Oryza meyeriana var. granulata]|uniref:Uncharacterized protein n=1 Tax=Oryza meyeriana var. granulata TaxID=110450 RepID=A0A6G1DBZ5_9ORYZ|nr:hypothetical protein E2562_001213 [Oryza meyeriana var. granulata]
MATGERRGRKSRVARAAMRALRGARDLLVRGAKGFGMFITAANPRAGVGRPTSRVFGVDELNSEQELRELVRIMQARRGAGTAGAGAGGKKKAETGAPAAWRGTAPLGRIDEDGALVDPTK